MEKNITSNKLEKKLVTTCCVCGTIELDGVLIPKGEYNEGNFDYTHTILSRECYDSFYQGTAAMKFKARDNIKYDSCKDLNSANSQ